MIAHDPQRPLDIAALQEQAAAWPGLEGMDLAIEVTCRQSYELGRDRVVARGRLRPAARAAPSRRRRRLRRQAQHPAHAGRSMAAGSPWCRRPPRPRTSCAIAPTASFCRTGRAIRPRPAIYAVPVLRELIDTGKPIFGICLGHQLLALGARRPHPQNGPAAIAAPITRSRTSQPARSRSPARITALSSTPRACRRGSSRPISRCSTTPTRGCASSDKPVFSVQHHPEASPGPQDSHYLFERFVNLMMDASGCMKQPG